MPERILCTWDFYAFPKDAWWSLLSVPIDCPLTEHQLECRVWVHWIGSNPNGSFQCSPYSEPFISHYEVCHVGWNTYPARYLLSQEIRCHSTKPRQCYLENYTPCVDHLQFLLNLAIVSIELICFTFLGRKRGVISCYICYNDRSMDWKIVWPRGWLFACISWWSLMYTLITMTHPSRVTKVPWLKENMNKFLLHGSSICLPYCREDKSVLFMSSRYWWFSGYSYYWMYVTTMEVITLYPKSFICTCFKFSLAFFLLF